MALINQFMTKNAIGKTAGQTLTLEATTGKSLLVRDIRVGANDATFADVTVEKDMVGRFRTAKALGTHLGFPWASGKIPITDYLNATIPKETILGYLGRKGLFTGFPIAEGQIMTIAPSVATAYLGTVQIIYEEYEAGDITEEMPNGSKADEYLFINYGDAGSAITTAGDYLINTVNSPVEFPDFPIGKDVPAKYEIDLLGLLATEAYDWDGAAQITYTTYLKLMRERETLFDEDRNGILMQGSDRAAAAVATYYGEGYSVVGNYSPIDSKEPFMFAEPITFTAGEELNVYITAAIVTAAASIAQAGGEVGFIERVRKVG